MRTYGVSMIYTRNGLVPCIMPYYTAEENNSLERGSRPYTVVEILREVFHEDVEKSIQAYMDLCPEGAAAAIGEKEAREFTPVKPGEPKGRPEDAGEGQISEQARTGRGAGDKGTDQGKYPVCPGFPDMDEDENDDAG